jgi:hypothetical protein
LTLGSGSGALAVSPGALTFGNLQVGNSATAYLSLVNHGPVPAQVSALSISGKSFSISNPAGIPLTLPSGATYQVAVRFTPAEAGAASGEIVLTSRASSGGKSVIHLSGAGVNAGAPSAPGAVLTPNSTTASFGDVSVNAAATQSLTLSSTGTSAVTITAASVSGPGFNSPGLKLPLTLPAGQSAAINVEFRPQSKGSARGSLVIASNSVTNPTITIPLAGNGVAQAVQLSWNQPVASSDPIAGYKVYRSVNGTAQYQLLSPSLAAQTAFTDSSVQLGQTYDYYVTSVDTAGAESLPSNTATVAIPGV